MAAVAVSSPVLSPEGLDKYTRDGYVTIPDFLSESEVAELRASCARLVDEMDPSEHGNTIFSTTNQMQSRSEYFIESGDAVRYFFEEDALDADGKLKVPKAVSLNKIGHALHWIVPEFRKVSFSEKVKSLARQLKFVSPALIQSMYIFKQPGYGGEVTPHKDCTFLSTEPQSCVGLWFALEDATLDNGCLWFSPGTQDTPTKRRFVRIIGEGGALITVFTAPPDTDDPSKYIAVPVKKGTAVVINGSVDHKSARNTSSNSRHVYTFHMIERHCVVWDSKNWLQPTQRLPFTGLYEN